MADKKISALTGATTPLTGTEVLPIVQGGATVKVSVDNLTSGRAVNSAGGTFTDNFVQGTAVKGVNFTANTPAAGMTSQLLNAYEEGTWTMGFSVASGSIPVLAGFTTGLYTRIGRQVTVTGLIVADTPTAPSGLLKITGLPFTCADSDSAYAGVGIYGQGFTGTVNSLVASVNRNSTEITIRSLSAGAISEIGAYMTQYSQFIISVTYFV